MVVLRAVLMAGEKVGYLADELAELKVGLMADGLVVPWAVY